MAKTDPLNPNVPAGGETPRQGDDRMRALARAVAELMDVDHYMGTDGGGETGYNEDAAGEHKHVKFNAPLDDDPTNAINKGFLYTKDVASKAELFWEDEDGNVTQLTNAGQLKVVTASIADNAITSAKIQDDITFDQFPSTPSAAPDADYEVANKKYADEVVQIVNTTDGTYATGSATIPADNTIPSWSEGKLYMTRTITPQKTTSKLKIDVVFHGAVATASRMFVTLHQDSGAALAVGGTWIDGSSTNAIHQVAFTHYMTAGTTDETTFQVRAGGQNVDLFFNAENATSPLMGGKMSSSITITELRA